MSHTIVNRVILQAKLESLAELLEADTIARLRQQGLNCEANIANARTRIKLGRVYAKVDIGTSGRLMVEISTGIIFGIKAYGKVHRGHVYGTLDTIHDWFWGHYKPQLGRD
jgi:hypothetical protein